jgi:membrane protein
MDVSRSLKDAYAGWSKHEVTRLAASLAYYAILSLAPLVVIVIGIAGVVFGADAARQGLLTQVQGLVGSEGAKMVGTMISHASTPKTDVVTGLVGVLTLLFGASGVFAELHESLDKVWEVENNSTQGFWAMLRERFLSFGMVLVVGFLLLVSLLLSSALAAMVSLFGNELPALVLQSINFLTSVLVITLLFAAIYRFLPSQRFPWRDLWVGSFGTSMAFVIGKFLVGFYLGRASVGSAYGAAGSLIVLLVWIYYAAQIFFIGAEFTRSYARRHGSLHSRTVIEQPRPMPMAAMASVTEPPASKGAQVTETKAVLSDPRRRIPKSSAKSRVLTVVVAVGWLAINWWREERQRRVR